MTASPSIGSRNFYPRHPRGWRRTPDYGQRQNCRISIHATLAGGDGYKRLAAKIKTQISIHATLAGGDENSDSAALLASLFLSTPPSRVATYRYKTLFHTYHRFYPRHPRVWRRSLVVLGIVSWLFLSTPPSRVATFGYLLWLLRQRCFYPRHPRGWRPKYTPPLTRHQEVSIHATLAGGDCGIPLASVDLM